MVQDDTLRNSDHIIDYFLYVFGDFHDARGASEHSKDRVDID